VKNIKLFTTAGLASVLLFSSCSLEKRHYTKGYSVDWNSNTPKATEQANKATKAIIETSKSVVTVKGMESNAKIESAPSPELTVSTSTTAATTKKVSKPALAKATTNANPTKANSNKVQIKQSTVMAAKIARKIVGEAKGMRLGLVIAGASSLFLGLIAILFISILFGTIIALAGLVMLIIGLTSKGTGASTNKNNDNGEYTEVVYLKNGSIIRGIIIEQIPNVSLKIKTKDGNVFFYKMEDVEKITKEIN
jgi:hypothetical protein